MPAKFALLITASADKTQSHLSAMKFARQAVSLGNEVETLFFYQDATAVANKLTLPPSDEPQLGELWEKLGNELNIEIQTCVAASYRRGVIDKTEAGNQAFDSHNLRESFKIAGLGQLAAAMSKTDSKLIHFK
jgi:tRNA 2-thiouridine synthesizing protein D